MKSIIKMLSGLFGVGKQQAEKPTTSNESHVKRPMTGEEKLAFIESDPETADMGITKVLRVMYDSGEKEKALAAVDYVYEIALCGGMGASNVLLNMAYDKLYSDPAFKNYR